MPHFQIDYSANPESRLDIPDLCAALRYVAVDTGFFPATGVRIRATACTHVVIADGNPDHAFLDLSVRLRGGRDLDARRKTTATIFAAAETFCAEMMATSSLMLSMKMRDIDPELSPKASSIRDHLPGDPR